HEREAGRPRLHVARALRAAEVSQGPAGRRALVDGLRTELAAVEREGTRVREGRVRIVVEREAGPASRATARRREAEVLRVVRNPVLRDRDGRTLRVREGADDVVTWVDRHRGGVARPRVGRAGAVDAGERPAGRRPLGHRLRAVVRAGEGERLLTRV